jgi:hypothetical protein
MGPAPWISRPQAGEAVRLYNEQAATWFPGRVVSSTAGRAGGEDHSGRGLHDSWGNAVAWDNAWLSLCPSDPYLGTIHVR